MAKNCQTLSKPSKRPNTKILAKVAKIRQIWSPCLKCQMYFFHVVQFLYIVATKKISGSVLDMNMTIDDAAPDTMRHVHSTRGISIQTLADISAQAKVKRALNTNTRPAVPSHDYNIGDLLDFHKTLATKDAS